MLKKHCRKLHSLQIGTSMNKHSQAKKFSYLTFLALTVISTAGMAAKFDFQQQQDIFDEKIILDPKDRPIKFSIPIDEAIDEPRSKMTKEDYLNIVRIIQKNNFTEAQEKIDNLLKQNPDNPDFHNLRALLEVAKKNPEIAQKSYEKSIELDKNNLIAHLGLARISINNGDFVKAKKHTETALTINDKSVNAHLLLADIAFNQKNYDEMENILNAALKKLQGNINHELRIADSIARYYLIKKQPDKILKISQELNQRHKNQSGALSFQARAQILNNQKPSALKTLEQIIDQDKTDIPHRLILAQLLSDKPENKKTVLALLDDVLELEPKNLQVLIFKTAYLTQLRQFKESLAVAEQVEKLYPELAVDKMLKGDIYLAQNDFDKALAIKQQAYAIQPNQKLLLIIARLMNKLDKPSQAIDLLTTEIDKYSEKNAIHLVLANLLHKQEKYDEAIKHYNALLSEIPDHVASLNNLAWLYSEQGNPQALEIAEKAYNLSSKSPIVADTYGVILINKGRNKEGLAVLQQAAKEAPEATIIQFNLAKAYVANGDKNQAMSLLEPLAINENFSEQKAAIKLLNELKDQ